MSLLVSILAHKARIRRAILIGAVSLMAVVFGQFEATYAQQRYDIRITENTLGTAIDALVQQTGVLILYPYEYASETGVKTVIGRYTVEEAYKKMLRGTRFSGGLTKNGVLTIALRGGKDSEDEAKSGRTEVTNNRKRGLLATVSALIFGAGGGWSAVAQDTSDTDDFSFEEIVVTATRSSQVLSKVPMSVSAYGRSTMDKQGVRKVDDFAQFTPGLQFDRSGYGLTSNIAIRGVSSLAGSATTGVYVDDTPIQVRSIGNSAANVYPAVFDLERVEVLRGPQGTLFGAGSEGGTVRFITPEPNLQEYEGYMRSELAFTKKGDPSYELGAAVGGPITEDKLAFRVSGFMRKDGGFVDRQAYPAGVHEFENTNSIDTYVFRGALKWQLSDTLSVTPSVYYQDLRSNDTSQYWLTVEGTEVSDPSTQDYVNGNVIPSTNHDWFVMPALKVRWDLENVSIASDTSYFKREEDGIYDYVAFMNNIFGFGNNSLTDVLSTPGYYDEGYLSNSQENWTQEIRINKADMNSRFTWIFGAFYNKSTQASHQDIANPFFDLVVANFGGTEFFYGLPALPGGVLYVDNFDTVDEQIAGFGEVSFGLLDGLKVTAGLRVAHSTLDFTTTWDGPAQGGAGAEAGSQSETPITPKFSVSYQADENNLYYATAAKGFRLGGVNRSVPTNAVCGFDLASTGYTAAPRTYDSDSLWSFEVGSKNRVGNFQIASSAYLIKWKDIIQSVNLPNCGFAFTDNLGKATIKGFDLHVDWQVNENISLTTQVGYTHGTYDETITLPGAFRSLVTEGHALGALYPTSPWVVTVSGQYDFDPVKNMEPYFRFDYNYRSKNNIPTGLTDPASFGYDPALPGNPVRKDLRIRAGIVFDGGLDVSLYVNNVTNESPVVNLGHVVTGGPIFQADAVRPVTAGLTASYRF